jgi:hypothetical protein
MPPPSRAKHCVDLFSYELPHTIYDTQVYPRESSNGSTIIIYGNEAGLRVVWYGGTKLKPTSTASPKANGHNKNETVVIDLDESEDDNDAETLPNAKAEFEDEAAALDATAPFHGVIRHIDIALGSACLYLACPAVSIELTDSIPAVQHDCIVVAAACADLNVKIVTLPLDPPAVGVIDLTQLNVRVTTLPAARSHQDVISSIALTYTTEGYEDSGGEESSPNSQVPLSLLVASTSSTGSGLLVVHQVPLRGTEPLCGFLIRRVVLRTPMLRAKLAFNTALTRTERDCRLLITLPDAPCVKVYQVFVKRQRPRRESIATTDSGSSSRSSSVSFGAGKVLVTLLPDFQPRTSAGCRRTRVLDAQWISNGRAIIALLEDGQWGVWDLEAAGPPSGDATIRGQDNVTGIIGGGWTRFAFKGPSDPRAKPREKTPDTATSEEKIKSLKGSICVRPSINSRTDNAILFNSGGQLQYVASIATYWKARLTGKGSIQSYDRPFYLPVLSTSREIASSALLLPKYAKEQEATFETQSTPNFLVTTSSRLILHVTPLAIEVHSDAPETGLQLTVEQSMLEHGDLDLDGVDRVLDDMARSRPSSRAQLHFQPTTRAKPNFGSSMMSMDGDIDMAMGSPTPIRAPPFSAQSKTASTGNSRRLFS